jgi:hypothetical protein
MAPNAISRKPGRQRGPPAIQHACGGRAIASQRPPPCGPRCASSIASPGSAAKSSLRWFIGVERDTAPAIAQRVVAHHLAPPLGLRHARAEVATMG